MNTRKTFWRRENINENFCEKEIAVVIEIFTHKQIIKNFDFESFERK